MKHKQGNNELSLIVGTPKFSPSDLEAEEWAYALIDMIQDQVDEFNSDDSPFVLQAFGLSCIVNKVFDVKSKAEGIAKQLTELSKDNIEFFVVSLDSNTDSINGKKIRDVSFAIRISGSAPFTGRTNIFITDEEYSEIINGGQVEWDGEIVTVYAVDADTATDIVMEIDFDDRY
jgi:hypothetical protein